MTEQKTKDRDLTVTIYPNVYTKQQIIEKHRKMWHGIAKMTRENQRFTGKEEYIRTDPDAANLPNDCYACVFAKTAYEILEKKPSSNITEYCKYCPLKWPTEKNTGMCMFSENQEPGLYLKWVTQKNEAWQEAADLAEQIANLPERKI